MCESMMPAGMGAVCALEEQGAGEALNRRRRPFRTDRSYV